MSPAKSTALFSTPEQKQIIQAALFAYLRLPFGGKTIPGAIVESLLAHVFGGKVTGTYDFVDVVLKSEKLGWQVKSTLAGTPVTWMRAKIPNKKELIEASHKNAKGRKALGKAIINYANAHAKASLEKHGLNTIGYARLVANKDDTITYFERKLCTRKQPLLFRPEDFIWKWSSQKKAVKKEQLPAFHGYHAKTKRKWFAWHGQGENQLHLTGEGEWWSKLKGKNFIRFSIPAATARTSWEKFGELFDKKSSVELL